LPRVGRQGEESTGEWELTVLYLAGDGPASQHPPFLVHGHHKGLLRRPGAGGCDQACSLGPPSRKVTAGAVKKKLSSDVLQ
jgi:hypothetical protein